MNLGLFILALWIGIALIASLRRVRGRRPAIAVAMFASGLALVAGGLWINQDVLFTLVERGLQVQNAPYHDTYYIVVKGNFALSLGAIPIVLSPVPA